MESDRNGLVSKLASPNRFGQSVLRLQLVNHRFVGNQNKFGAPFSIPNYKCLSTA